MYKQAIWDVTSQCNLRCKHCYASTKYDAATNDMSLDDAKKTIDNLYSMGFTNILLLGGEPLFRKDIFPILEYATKLNLNIMINTNGTLLTKDISVQLLNNNVTQISISFEGTVPQIHDSIAGHGSYKRTLSGLETFMSERQKMNSNILTGIQYTIMKPALQDASNFLDFALDQGVNGLSVNFVDNNGRVRQNEQLLTTPEEYIDSLELILYSVQKNTRRIDKDFLMQFAGKQILIEYLSCKYNFNIMTNPTGYKCPAGSNIILVQSDGTVTPCGMANNHLYYTPEFYNKYQVENINVLEYSSTQTLYRTKFFSDFLKFKNRKNALCASCNYLESCQICPIQYSTEIMLCQIAKERYDKWRISEEMKKLRLEIKPEIYNAADSEFSKYILSQMGQNISLNDLSQKVAEETAMPIEIVKEDIWSFYNSIKLYKL